jgi:hypothetical protein
MKKTNSVIIEVQNTKNVVVTGLGLWRQEGR